MSKALFIDNDSVNYRDTNIQRSVLLAHNSFINIRKKNEGENL